MLDSILIIITIIAFENTETAEATNTLWIMDNTKAVKQAEDNE